MICKLIIACAEQGISLGLKAICVYNSMCVVASAQRPERAVQFAHAQKAQQKASRSHVCVQKGKLQLIVCASSAYACKAKPSHDFSIAEFVDW